MESDASYIRCRLYFDTFSIYARQHCLSYMSQLRQPSCPSHRVVHTRMWPGLKLRVCGVGLVAFWASMSSEQLPDCPHGKDHHPMCGGQGPECYHVGKKKQIACSLCGLFVATGNKSFWIENFRGVSQWVYLCAACWREGVERARAPFCRCPLNSQWTVFHAKHRKELQAGNPTRREDAAWAALTGSTMERSPPQSWAAASTSSSQVNILGRGPPPGQHLPSAAQGPAAPTWDPPPTPPAPPRQMSPAETAARLFGASSTTAKATAQGPAPTGSSRASSPTVPLGADQTALLKEILVTQQRIMNEVQTIKARCVLTEERIHALQDGLREVKSKVGGTGWS